MKHETDKINRQVYFPTAQVLDTESTVKNNTWVYDRAPEGYKFVLISAQMSNVSENDNRYGLIAIYDGHEYTQWNQFPGVESHELLGRLELHNYTQFGVLDLNQWECKEFTIGTRSTSSSHAFKCVVIVWYFLRKMNEFETKQYAVLQPKGDKPIRKSGPTTVEGTE